MSSMTKIVRRPQQTTPQVPNPMGMTVDTSLLQHLTPAQRANIVMHLANLLILAAAGAARENDHDNP